MNKRSFPTRSIARIALLFIVALLVLSTLNMSAASPVIAQEPTPTDDDSGKIVGGAPATPGEWPWQVALVGGTTSDLFNGQFCGGSLITANWVLTAAHCVTNSGVVVAPSSVDIVAGIYNLSSPAAGYQRRDISQIIVHSGYNYQTYNNDIALLRLATPVTLGGSGETTVATIPLVSASIGDLTGAAAWVTGWGYTESSPAWPSQLYEVDVPVIDNTTCNTAYGGDITANMMCAGLAGGGKDSCQGDSGGPIVINNGGQWQLAGVVSWGTGCADPGYYGVYTRVSNFITWINTNAYVFGDVTGSYWARTYIEALYNNGYTAGCSTSPLLYCPETVMSRVESSVFMLRGNFGSGYTPPVEPWDTFADNWTAGPWAEKWAEGLYDAGLTAGCNTNPLMFCPWDQTPRAQLAVFGTRLRHGSAFIPPAATGNVFADITDPNLWYAKWAEQAYADGLIPSCGTSGGKPMFCPNDLVTRALAAYTVVEAKNLIP